jgi:acetyl-CoA carboxylase biotin carboxylase subunit
MFKKILIANRGEIALRVVRACRELGVASWPCTPPRMPTRCMCAWPMKAICIGPRPPAKAICRMAASCRPAEITGASAIHPGYGFLSENANFVQAVEDHGLKFIGPRRSISA